MDIITQLICKKNKISYIIFDKTLKIQKYNHTVQPLIDDTQALQVNKDIRGVLWELVGLEESLMKLLEQNSDVLNFPMIMKKDEYYDLDIETYVNEEDEKLFIAYLIEKPKESLSHINMIKEINKKTLVYESENKKDKEKYYGLINQRLLSFNVDLNGIIVSINSVFSHFFDIADSEIIGEHFSRYFKARDYNLINTTTLIFNALNTKDELISFHAEIIPISENDTVYENIIICQDITYLKQIEKELEYAAGHDSLTGLPNRSQLLSSIDIAIDECKKSAKDFSICFIDLNKFKVVNDNYGYHAGDMLLKHIAKVLSDFVRKKDIVSRIGGDEFVILLDALEDEKDLNTMIQRLKKLPSKHLFIYSEEDTIEYGFSIGVASYPKDATDATSLIKLADKAMYLQKRGR